MAGRVRACEGLVGARVRVHVDFAPGWAAGLARTMPGGRRLGKGAQPGSGGSEGGPEARYHSGDVRGKIGGGDRRAAGERGAGNPWPERVAHADTRRHRRAGLVRGHRG
jgi:hypothetical protein